MTADVKPGAHHLRTGNRGEILAAQFLESQRMVVLTRNWRCREGELDLVATDGHRLVVVEVKTRTSTSHGPPADAVDRHKAARIRRVARRWRIAHSVPWCEERFDIVAVLWPPHGNPRITHYRGAF